MGSHALLQGIFQTQGSNPCSLHLLPWQAGSLSPSGKPMCSIKCTVFTFGALSGSVALRTFTANATTSALHRTLSSPQAGTLSPLNGSSPPLPQPQQRKLCLQSLSGRTPGTSCKWNDTVSVLLCRAHPTEPDVLKARPCCNSRQHVAPSRLSNALLCGWTTCCLSICCNSWVAPLRLL